ncbi:MAG TPA: XRE family transcriptional regulator [Phenylobacterium sp.]|jgi:transcriptional regulator with XRE-family HTH domain|uniref:XRE family transcriptional regulator n=1 Tax=Phenylobacterium sp. TaxID=1871053 RepID=UPI002C00639A|nr:XRE family transcriptional regulator [Phenylobacterium sp.]HXA39579.1 XRE family transcriptional regulator [Phenylobacterium sp.]
MRSRLSDKTGAAIRKLRLARGWNLATLSEESGVPISTLSRVELGQNALNYDKLMRLCRALEVDLEGLMTREAEGAAAPSGRRAVIRAGEGEPVRVGPAGGRAAAADLLSKSFSPTILEVTAETLDAHGPPVVQPGEAYVLVLGGAVEFHSHLYAPLALASGDAVHFDAASGYALLARGGPARVLLVTTGDLPPAA